MTGVNANVAVIDTNVFVSAVLYPESSSAACVEWLLTDGVILFSKETLEELRQVLFRRKFDRQASLQSRRAFFDRLSDRGCVLVPKEKPTVCRDPNDDIILAVALAGEADVIISGDKDLLSLHPFGDICILSPRRFVEGRIQLETKK